MALKPIGYRVAAHAFGFFAVAFLGIHLSDRLHAVQEELEEKIDSLRQLQRLNEHIVSSIRSGLVTTDLHGQIAVFNSTAEELTERRSGQALVHARPVDVRKRALEQNHFHGPVSEMRGRCATRNGSCCRAGRAGSSASASRPWSIMGTSCSGTSCRSRI